MYSLCLRLPALVVVCFVSFPLLGSVILFDLSVGIFRHRGEDIYYRYFRRLLLAAPCVCLCFGCSGCTLQRERARVMMLAIPLPLLRHPLDCRDSGFLLPRIWHSVSKQPKKRGSLDSSVIIKHILPLARRITARCCWQRRLLHACVYVSVFACQSSSS